MVQFDSAIRYGKDEKMKPKVILMEPNGYKFVIAVGEDDTYYVTDAMTMILKSDVKKIPEYKFELGDKVTFPQMANTNGEGIIVGIVADEAPIYQVSDIDTDRVFRIAEVDLKFKLEPKFSVGQEVLVQSWTHSDQYWRDKVAEVKWFEESREIRYGFKSHGYVITYRNEDTIVAFQG